MQVGDAVKIKKTGKVWAECKDGHTTLAGINVDELTIGELCKWAGAIPWCSQKNMEAKK